MFDPNFDPYRDLMMTIATVQGQSQLLEKLVECNNNLAAENRQLLTMYRQMRQRIERLELQNDIKQATTNNSTGW